MKKLVAYALIIAWFVLVLEFTTSQLAGNKIIYFVVTIPALVIPTEIIKRFLIYRNKDSQ